MSEEGGRPRFLSQYFLTVRRHDSSRNGKKTLVSIGICAGENTVYQGAYMFRFRSFFSRLPRVKRLFSCRYLAPKCLDVSIPDISLFPASVYALFIALVRKGLQLFDGYFSGSSA
jgi:hypothetical protein